MSDPRRRILVTTIVAFALAVGVVVAIVGTQRSSGRMDLTQRARSFVLALKGIAEGPGGPADPASFLRSADRANPRLVESISRLRGAFEHANDDLPIVQVKLLGDGRAVSYTPVASTPSARGGAILDGVREIAWVRGDDGVWYVDPTGL